MNIFFAIWMMQDAPIPTPLSLSLFHNLHCTYLAVPYCLWVTAHSIVILPLPSMDSKCTSARILLERYSEIEYCIAVLIANTGYHKLSVHLLDTQIVHITKIQYLCSHHIKCIHKNRSEDLVVLGTKLRNIIYKFLTVLFYTISKPLKNSTAGL